MTMVNTMIEVDQCNKPSGVWFRKTNRFIYFIGLFEFIKQVKSERQFIRFV
jgi:Zn-finger nucleic acid-binding protein